MSSLVSYAVLRSLHSQSKDVLSAFTPFVEIGIHMVAKNQFSLDDLRSAIQQNAKLNLPLLTLKTILKRMARKSDLTILGDSSGKCFVQLEKNYQDEHQNYGKLFEQKERNLNKLLHDLRVFAHFEGTDAELIKVVEAFIFISAQTEDILSREENSACYENGTFAKIAEFLKYIKKYESGLFETFCELYYGFLLSRINRTEDIEKYKRNLKNITVYLDSSFILRLLNFQSDEEYSSSSETLAALKRFGFNIEIHIEIIEEARDVIQRKLENMSRSRELPLADQMVGNYVGGVAGAIIRRGIRPDQLEESIQNFEKDIKDQGIVITRTREIESQKVSDTEIAQLFEIKVRKLLSRYSTGDSEYELFDSVEFRSRTSDIPEHVLKNIRKKSRIDLQIISLIRSKRSNHEIYSFEDSKFIFLTCDKVFYHFDKGRSKKLQITNIMLEDVLVNTLWLYNGETVGENAEISRIISMFQSSKYLEIGTISSFFRMLKEHMNRSPDDLRRFDLILNNQYTYSRLKEIEVSGEPEGLDVLIKELAENAGKALDEFLEKRENEFREKQKSEMRPLMETTDSLRSSVAAKDVEIEDLATKLTDKEQVITGLASAIRISFIILGCLIDFFFAFASWSVLTNVYTHIVSVTKFAASERWVFFLVVSILVFLVSFEFFTWRRINEKLKDGKFPSGSEWRSIVLKSLGLTFSLFIVQVLVSIFSGLM